MNAPGPRLEDAEGTPRRLVGSVLAASLILALGGCAVTEEERLSRGGDRYELAAIEDLHRKDMAAARNGDLEDLVSLWSEEAVAMPPRGPMVAGKSAIRRMIEGNLAQLVDFEVVEYVLDFEEVEIFGDHAVEYGTYRGTYRSKADGATVRGRGKLMRVLERQPDGTWLVARSIWNEDESKPSDPPKGEPAACRGDAGGGAPRCRFFPSVFRRSKCLEY